MTRVPKPGQLLARGVCRHLRQYDFACIPEFAPAPGLRVDVMALGPRGEVWVVECKSSRADFRSDGKWHGYRQWCDRFFWAVGREFPVEILPGDCGLILADSYGGEILRFGAEFRLAAPRRRSVMLKFARKAASRLQGLCDRAPCAP